MRWTLPRAGTHPPDLPRATFPVSLIYPIYRIYPIYLIYPSCPGSLSSVFSVSVFVLSLPRSFSLRAAIASSS